MPDTLKDKDLLLGVLAASNIATAVINTGTFIYVNAAFARMSGFAAADLPGLTLDALFGGSCLWDGKPGDGDDDRRLVRKDGSTVWVHASAAPLSAEGEAPQGLVLQLIDIERQKQVEAALLVNERRLNFALEAATQGVWDVDIPSNEVYFSSSWRTMRGIPPGEAVDGSLEGWMSRIHPDDRYAVMQSVQRERSMQSGARILEYRERHRDGHYIWIQNRGQDIAWDEHDKPTRIIGTDTDVSDRKAAESELQRVSRRLELALDASRIGVWEQDLTTQKLIWDRRMDEIYKRKPARDLVDQFWERSVHPDDRAGAAFDFTQAVEGGKKYASEYRIICADGEIRYLRSRAQVFEDVDGSRKIVGAEWDVTADVRLQEELQKAKALAETRYAELKNAQARLRHAALHDELTDLPNRRYLNQVLVERRAQRRARQGNLALMHIDLDWFKEINDRLGHDAGDVMLRHVADILRANVRDGDFVARVGGDEFVMLCWFNGDISDLSLMAERIIDELREEVPYEGQLMRVGASIGIAYEASAGVAARPLLRDADIALYRAKELGRNRYEFAA